MSLEVTETDLEPAVESCKVLEEHNSLSDCY